jgi:DNA-binding transcriptional MocR family regulator
MMTNWLPDLSQGSGPLYVRLAERIEQDIEAGVLAEGAKLPPQRNLAFDVGVTIGTVGRAYALARERGLVSGEVGRGTYVLARRETAPSASPSPLPQVSSGVSDDLHTSGILRFDTTAAPEIGAAKLVERITAEVCREYPNAVSTYIRGIPRPWVEAGAQWLARSDWRPSPSDIVPTLGAHAAIMAAIGAVTAPGDRILFENLTYASVARSSALMGRRATPVASDRDGILPDDLERLCAQQHPKMLFLMPAPQNPTVAFMSEARRRAITEIAQRYQLWIIEDAVYGVLLDDELPTLAALAPERVFHLGSLSKAVAAGLRGGWIACPPNLASRVSIAHRMVTGGSPFLMSEIAARMVRSGEADELKKETLATIGSRVALARDIFAGLDVRLHDRVPFLWLTLPEPWLSSTFKAAAAAENILIDDEDEYKPVRSDAVYHGVRIGFSSVLDTERVGEGFRALRRLVDQGTGAYDTYN